MAEIASAYVSLIPSFKGGGAKIASQLGGPVDAAGKSSGKRFGNAMSTGIGGLGTRIFAPLAAAAAAVGFAGFFKDAVTGASDLVESTTKIDAIFGTAAGAVQDFAGKGAKALGQTKLDVLNSAASFGTFGKAAGLQGKELAGFSTGLSTLSTDMASFFNTDPTQAAEAIAAGLRGEAEPLRQFGVLLDDATLRQEAMRLGLTKTTKEALTPQQKVLAAQAAIYKQTGDAQGDFNRTSGGLANQQRILKAQFTDMKTNIGGALLPIVLKAVTGFNSLFDQIKSGSGPLNAIKGPLGWITAGIKVFIDALRGKDVTNGGVLGTIGGIAYGIRDAFQAAFPIVKQFVTGGLKNLASAGGAIMKSLGPVLKQLPGLFSALLPVLMTVGSTILTVFKGAFAIVGPIISTVIGVIIGLFKLILPAVAQLAPVIGAFLVSLQGLAGTLIAAFQVVWPPIQRLIAGILSQLVPGLKSIFQVISTEVVPALKSFAVAIAPIVAWLVDKLAPIVRVVFGVVIAVIKNAMKIIAGVIKVVTSVIKGDWKGAWDGIKKILSGVWGIIKAVVVGAMKVMSSVISTGLDVIKAVWGRVWDAVKALAGKAWDGIKSLVSAGVQKVKDFIGKLSSIASTIGGFFQRAVDAVKTKIGDIVDFVRGLPGKITGALGNMGSTLYEAGKSVISGLLNGIKDAVQGVLDFAGTIAGKIREVKGPLSKDKKLLVPAGKAIVGGLVTGLESEYGTVKSSLQGLTKSMTVSGGSIGLPTVTGGGAAVGTTAGAGGGVTINGGVHGYTAQEVATEVVRLIGQRETLAFAGGR